MVLNPHFVKQLSRTQPGAGADQPDDGVRAPVKSKSVPNVSTPRLQHEQDRLHQKFHTAEGLHEHEGPRRDLIDNGMKGRMVAHELMLRGLQSGDCEHCRPGPLPEGAD